MSILKGIEQLYYAIMTTEDTPLAQAVYSAPVRIPVLQIMKETPTVDSAQVWGDDGLDEVNNKIGLVTLELTVKELTLATQAALLGHSYVSGVVSRGMNDIVPYVAVGWVGKKTNNHFRYQWYLKGKFEVPTNSHETEADKIKLQPAIIKGTFFPRKFDLLLERVIDQDDPSYIPSQGTNWFSYVESSPTTLTCVAAPIQGATAVPKHLPTITWTYSNAIAGGQLIPGNFSSSRRLPVSRWLVLSPSTQQTRS
jgi:phi13 family phage major tail protein